MRRVVALVVVLPVILAAGVGLAAVPALSTALSPPPPPAPPASAAAIPAGMLELYVDAASTCPGLSWSLLAAIGTVESGSGSSALPGVHSGSNRAGAEGPMQFEPSTFDHYAFPVPPEGADPPSPYDPVDAVYAAARMLCDDGAADPVRLGAAVFDYNHSLAYVAQVLSLAGALGEARPGAAGVGGAGRVAVQYALSQVGTPYRWGGESPGAGFDCSGLVQAAWAAAGVELPRVAQGQFDAGPAVAPGQSLAPGDLVFFGTGPADVTHVGLVVDPSGVMVDAPHIGAAVRVEPFPTRPGATWGSDLYLGATSPGG